MCFCVYGWELNKPLVLFSWDLILSPYWEGGRRREGGGWVSFSSLLLSSAHLTSPHRPSSQGWASARVRWQQSLPSCPAPHEEHTIRSASIFLLLNQSPPHHWLPPVGCSNGSSNRDSLVHIPWMHDSVCLLWFLLFFSASGIVSRPISVGATNPFGFHGCCYDPNDWLVSSQLYGVCAIAQGFLGPVGSGLAGLSKLWGFLVSPGFLGGLGICSRESFIGEFQQVGVAAVVFEFALLWSAGMGLKLLNSWFSFYLLASRSWFFFLGVGAWRNHPLFFSCTKNSCVISWNQCFLVEFLVAVWYRIVWISSCFVRHREGWLFVEMVGLSLIAVEPFWICCWFLNIFFYLGLDACMKAMPLKHRTPFFFNYFHHFFFRSRFLCWITLLYSLFDGILSSFYRSCSAFLFLSCGNYVLPRTFLQVPPLSYH